MVDPFSIALAPIIDHVRRDAEVPGLIVAVARGEDPPVHFCTGTDAQGRPIEPQSLFPVASITKLATALAVLCLVERGGLALDDPLSAHLPDVAAEHPGVTVRSLLCHISGLPADVPEAWAPYGPGTDWPVLAQAALRVPLEAPPATRVAYNGVGYLLLGLLVERQTGTGIAEALDELVFAPLGMEAYLGVEPPRAPAAIADVAGPERGTDLEPFNSAFWRSLPDPTAGLLTTAAGTIALVRAFRGVPAGFLDPATCAEATRDQTGGLAGGLLGIIEWAHCPWGLGPMLHNPAPPPFTPAQGGPGSFGHTGYSVGYVWVSPDHDLTWAVLGTRTYDNGWPITHGPAIEAVVLGDVSR